MRRERADSEFGGDSATDGGCRGARASAATSGEPAANPDAGEATDFGAFRVLNLDALVRVKLTAFRRKDQVHLLDLIGVGMIDRSWDAKLPPALGVRLRTLLDTPDE